MSRIFRVGVTRDFLKPDAPQERSKRLWQKLGFGDIGLQLLGEAEGVEWEFLANNVDVLRPEQVREYDALIVLAPRVTARTLEGADRLKIIARFGVGYDNIDVDACTRKGVMLTITPDGVRRPVAAAAMTFLLALSHKLLVKDQSTRAGRWADRLDHIGQGLTGRTLGVIGVGNIGREVFRLAAPFEMRHIGYDPYVNRDALSTLDVELVDLETLLQTADYVVICCLLVPETRRLINAERLALMKPTAYLINVARGPIVDQKALTTALRERRIQGAGLDVFEEEPIDPNDPLLKLDNVIVTPHAICWTDECFLGIGRYACQSILDVAAGRVPRNVVNPAVLEKSGLRANLSQYRKQRGKQ
ncbi:hydroxyacid dehydrogenase [Acidobacteria bacterium AH-259-L09]|nr:hydroxyacid dehydrogenase [Acidobacteria bacterium AH-259-L09]